MTCKVTQAACSLFSFGTTFPLRISESERKLGLSLGTQSEGEPQPAFLPPGSLVLVGAHGPTPELHLRDTGPFPQ